MTEMLHFSDEDISTEYSALMSKVMTGGHGKIKFPINEPAEGRRKSQIEEYLDFFGGPGVQHVALLTRGHRRHRRRAPQPRRALPRHARDVLRRGRVARGRDRQSWEDVRRLKILADRDDDGYLLQIFTKPVQDRPTIFFEVIERHGCARLRTGQLQGAVRGDRARAGAARKPLSAMPPRTEYARSGEIELAYQVVGDGDHDVVLMLDWASHLEVAMGPAADGGLPDVARTVRDAFSGSTCVASGCPIPVADGASAPEDWVDDVTAVMDAAGFDRAAVIAQGHAVQRALMASATHPERIDRRSCCTTASRASPGQTTIPRACRRARRKSSSKTSRRPGAREPWQRFSRPP